MTPHNDGADLDTGPIEVRTTIPNTIAPQSGSFTTSFTTAESNVPPGHPKSALPTARELGLARKPRPQYRWRKIIRQLSGDTSNFGDSAGASMPMAFTDRAIRPISGSFSIAVLSLKGGVGKTTTAVSLGATLASMRGDRVIAVDANPDLGTLAQRGPSETRLTVRDLLADQHVDRYSDVRRYTSQSSSRLELLASERDPAVSEAFSEADYRAVHDILQRFYNIILTDCGTGLTHSAMAGVLDEADALVLVLSPAIDSARSALATLDWLQHHSYARLVPNTRAVISCARPGPMPVDISQLSQHFLPRVHSVRVIPYDRHLAEGAEISLELMARKTRQAYADLATSIAQNFAK
nr:ESX-1 secretion-associated protein EspI [Mycolicibacterium sp.]